MQKPTETARPCKCYNCDKITAEDELKTIVRYHERVQPGDTGVPAGECPACGCLAYVVEREMA